MTNNYTVNVSVNDHTQKILNDLGLSLSDAVNIFLDRISIEGRIPFDYPENSSAVSDDEILFKLEEAEENFRKGNFYTENEFWERFEKKYNV